MSCEKCGAPLAIKYEFTVHLEEDNNPFEKEARVLGRGQAEVCPECAQKNRKTKVIAVLIAIGVLLAGLAVRLTVFGKHDVSILDVGAAFLTLVAIYGIYDMTKQSQTLMGELAAARFYRDRYLKDGLTLEPASKYHVGDDKALAPFESLPELSSGEHLKAVGVFFPESIVAKITHCDFCGTEKGEGPGLEIPFVAGWVRTHSGAGYSKFTWYGFAPFTFAACPACLQSKDVPAFLRSLKKRAEQKGREAIAANKKDDKPLLDSESVLLLTPARFREFRLASLMK
jgi:hypothetical protein